ncbi:hypothetical protein BW735_23230 [Escherichia coli]|nr:hypothetical protein BW735_23230 [Escherichia coli]
MLPSETMIWQPEFTDKTLSRKPGAVQIPEEHPCPIVATTMFDFYCWIYFLLFCVNSNPSFPVALSTSFTFAENSLFVF